jgi:tetratricopeptide (TPR) repeat protein
MDPSNRKHDVWICLLLAAITLAVYWQVRGFDFTNYDDRDFASRNPIVLRGLTWDGVKWALTTHHFDYWHPLAWLSHMLDVQLFGLNAGAHHLSSVFIHLLNVVLLYLTLWRMTGAWDRSAFVAALFALHPLNVDSVAWVAERKNVLSTTFWLLTMWAYARYVERPRPGRYLMTLAAFALGLMAKPMLVTLPFVLLLLDYWPLGRVQLARAVPVPEQRNTKHGTPAGPILHPPSSILHSVSRLLLEKLPFLALALAACVITYATAAAKGFVVPAEKFPLLLRVLAVPVAYVSYLAKTFWPLDLSVLYPHRGAWSHWMVAGAILILLCVSVFVFCRLRRQPYLTVGWLWFLGALVPVIGLVQTGSQYVADRWTYVPNIGLFVLVTWGAADLAARWKIPVAALRTGAAIILLTCASLTFRQIPHWRNSVTLFSHAVAVTRDNAVAHNNLGVALGDEGRLQEAVAQFQEALRIQAEYVDARRNLGVALGALGRWPEATNQFHENLRLRPDHAATHHELGAALFKLGDYAGASNHLTQAAALDPKNADTQFKLGFTLATMGQPAQAIAHYEKALRIEPGNAAAHNGLAKALSAQGRVADAIPHFFEAVRLKPDHDDARLHLGLALASQGDLGGALLQFSEAVKLNPTNAPARATLAMALHARGQTAEAIAQYREALRLKPDLSEALNNLAWILATHPEAQFRNGREAIELAERACAATGRRQPVFLGTLAAAYAEAGQFDKAIEAARQARDLAEAQGQQETAARNQQLLELYRQSKPWREAK